MDKDSLLEKSGGDLEGDKRRRWWVELESGRWSRIKEKVDWVDE